MEWEYVAFPWGGAVRSPTGEWTTLFIFGQEVNVENKQVQVYNDRIEFIEKNVH